MKNDVGRNNVCYVHLTLVPYVNASEEFKSKPTQHSVNQLRSIGIQPDAIIARSEKPIGEPLKEKIALFGDVDDACRDQRPGCELDLPGPADARGSGARRLHRAALRSQCDAAGPHRVAGPVRSYLRHRSRAVRIALVGKYVEMPDAYISVIESLRHAAVHCGADLQSIWVNSEHLDEDMSPLEGDRRHRRARRLRPSRHRGQGARLAIRARAPGAVPRASASECSVPSWISPARFSTLPTQTRRSSTPSPRTRSSTCSPSSATSRRRAGRCGSASIPASSRPGHAPPRRTASRWCTSATATVSSSTTITARPLAGAGVVFSGTSPNGRLVEIIELRDHPFFVGSQFHPEFRSRPGRPHPLFRAFMAAATKGITVESAAPPPVRRSTVQSETTTTV